MTTSKDIILGVLALQGAFKEHLEYFQKVIEGNPEQYSKYNFKFIEVRTPEELEQCDSLVIPGGESTSISLIAERTQMLQPLLDFVKDESKSVWGTCAGLIFLSKQLKNGKVGQKLLGALNVQVVRNAFGRQVNSFESHLDFSSFIKDCHDFPAVFIRAPVIDEILDQDNINNSINDPTITKSSNNYNNKSPVKVLYSLDNFDNNNNHLIVAVRQGRKLGTSFHPELATKDYRFHKWFIDEFVLGSDRYI
ncbi:SNO glutamine amidotransferase family-domain-containing protein [Scheffersomyces amazonensis]|uniref:SNO glutamine amidotransferase family-domain-containing protein n=1 Tax=Scheffersomyces amazonensis TaxID=1078765 RepID=UPI00315CC62C